MGDGIFDWIIMRECFYAISVITQMNYQKNIQIL